MIRFLEPLANPWKVEQQWQVPFTALSLFFWLVKDFSSTISKECSNFWVQHHRCSTKFNKWYQLWHLNYKMGKSTLHCSLCRELARCVSAIQIAASKYRLGGTPKGAKCPNSQFWILVRYLIPELFFHCFIYNVCTIHTTVCFLSVFQPTKFWNMNFAQNFLQTILIPNSTKLV